MHYPIAALLALVFYASACGEPDPEANATESHAVTGASELEIPRPPYRASFVPNGGTIAGAVELVGDVPADTTVEPPVGSSECSAGTIRIPLIQRSGRRVAEVIVWLDDARAGKPLPDTRRFTIAIARCGFEPRVQAAIAGGMLNVMSHDPIEHRTRFVAASNGKTIETILQHDAGAVVPVETVLKRAGRVLVRSDLHTWMRGWIQVFDHPYFTVTGAAGDFRLDDVPPGRYRLVAWHPRLGERDTTVSVNSAAATRLVMRF
ncbi:MAG: carboxypeptidase regulatory-like domain-containing protein [Gemmatimonadaceae bacterium]